MSSVLRSTVVLTTEQLHELSERTLLAAIRSCVDTCHCCDVRPADMGGVLCNVCRATEEKESE